MKSSPYWPIVKSILRRPVWLVTQKSFLCYDDIMMVREGKATNKVSSWYRKAQPRWVRTWTRGAWPCSRYKTAKSGKHDGHWRCQEVTLKKYLTIGTSELWYILCIFCRTMTAPQHEESVFPHNCCDRIDCGVTSADIRLVDIIAAWTFMVNRMVLCCGITLTAELPKCS